MPLRDKNVVPLRDKNVVVFATAGRSAHRLTVADTARAVAFLASPDSTGVNGQTLTVDAGYSLG